MQMKNDMCKCSTVSGIRIKFQKTEKSEILCVHGRKIT